MGWQFEGLERRDGCEDGREASPLRLHFVQTDQWVDADVLVGADGLRSKVGVFPIRANINPLSCHPGMHLTSFHGWHALAGSMSYGRLHPRLIEISSAGADAPEPRVRS